MAKLGKNELWSLYSLEGGNAKMRFKDLPICVIVKGNCLEWYTWINLKSNGSQIFLHA